ncbi:hypothetical protein LTR85_006439 [Meristemomyces frigidus]|nr:hypothetical protein LTR85_006439 [Meristemomyces frigidus]
MADFTKIYRRTTYPTISPSAPSQDQSGRTVLLTGGSEGIGYGIAEAFAQAHAATVILVSRSQDKLDKAAAKLESKYPETEVKTISSDSSDAAAIAALWQKLANDNISVDVLFLNAGALGEAKDLAEIISFFNFNIIANLHQLEHFQNQPNQHDRQKILVNITSASVQCYNYPRAAYPGSKAGFANYICHASEATTEDKLRMITLHPGAVFTPFIDNSGMLKDLPIWDHPSLSAHTAVWVCGKDAGFLHGRFVWANWDADELLTMKERVLGDAAFMRVGVTGVPSFTTQKHVALGEFDDELDPAEAEAPYILLQLREQADQTLFDESRREELMSKSKKSKRPISKAAAYNATSPPAKQAKMVDPRLETTRKSARVASKPTKKYSDHHRIEGEDENAKQPRNGGSGANGDREFTNRSPGVLTFLEQEDGLQDEPLARPGPPASYTTLSPSPPSPSPPSRTSQRSTFTPLPAILLGPFDRFRDRQSQFRR